MQNSHLKQFLLSTGDDTIVENVPDSYWGIGKDGNGSNVAGQILQYLRYCFSIGASPFPLMYVVGDSMVRNLEVSPVVKVLSISGAEIDFTTTVAEAVAGAPVRVVLVFCGTNDLFQRDGSIKPPKSVS